MAIKNTSILKKLEKSGLTDKESAVYLALLELGGAFPSKIALHTGIKRSTVYNVLVNLSVRGLINEIEKSNKLFYQIQKPDRFIKYSESLVRRAEDSLETAKTLLPEIEALHGMLGDKPKITYYEGTEGIMEIYSDHISSKKPYEMLAWANISELWESLPKEFFDSYVKSKEKIGITTRGIVSDTNEGKKFNNIRYDNIAKPIWPVMRFAPQNAFPMQGEITIYGKNKVSIVNFSKTNAIGTIIEDEKIHQMMTTIFNLSWESAALKK
ncbi:MAG: helix-turn-helix domain-containing protein [Patescibacteria group bacterium]